MRPCGTFICQNFVTFSVLGRHTPTPATRGVEESTVRLLHAKCHPIGAKCRPYGAKKLKIVLLVTEIPALCAAQCQR